MRAKLSLSVSLNRSKNVCRSHIRLYYLSIVEAKLDSNIAQLGIEQIVTDNFEKYLINESLDI